MKKLLLLVLLPLLFINCSSDDNDTNPTIVDPNPTVHPIVGTWKYIEIGAIVEGTNLTTEIQQKIIYLMDPAPGSNGEIHITFNADGTGMTKHFEDNSIDPFTYSIKDNVITIVEDDPEEDDQDIDTFEIKGNRLIINSSDQEELKYYQNLFPLSGITRTDRTTTFERM